MNIRKAIIIFFCMTSIYTRSSIGFAYTTDCTNPANAEMEGIFKINLKFMNLVGEQVKQKFESKLPCQELNEFLVTIQIQTSNIKVQNSNGKWEQGNSVEMNKIISKKLPDIIGDVMDILKQIKMGDNDLTILKFKVNESKKDVFLNIRLANDHAKIMHEKYNLDYIGESIFKFHKDGYLVLPEMYRHTWNLKNGFPQQSKLANIKLI